MEFSNSFVKIDSDNKFLFDEFRENKEKMEKFLTYLLNKNNDCVVAKTASDKLKECFDHIDDIIFLRGVSRLDEQYDLRNVIAIRTKKDLLQFVYDNGIRVEDYNIRKVYPRFIEVNYKDAIMRGEKFVDEVFKTKGDVLHRIFGIIDKLRTDEFSNKYLELYDTLNDKMINLNLEMQTKDIGES